MKVVFEFDYGWFWFNLGDFLSGPLGVEKKRKKEGKDEGQYWKARGFQLIATLLLPITVLISFFDSVRIYQTGGI